MTDDAHRLEGCIIPMILVIIAFFVTGLIEMCTEPPPTPPKPTHLEERWKAQLKALYRHETEKVPVENTP